MVPGRAYTVSVRTVSGNQQSVPSSAKYRTIPLRPKSVSVDSNSIGSYNFSVLWSRPTEFSDFDRYQIALGINRSNPFIVEHDQPLEANFDKGLHPGRTYTVVVKTVSGSVASWPTTANVTTRPLPVMAIQQSVDEETGKHP